MVKVTVADICMLPTIYELESNLFREEAYSLSSLKEELESKSRLYLVALNHENLVVAYVGVNLLPDMAEIMKIGVSKDYQNKGIATKLLSSLVSELAKRNLNQIQLEVDSTNLPAISLYENFGFKKISTRNSYYSNGANALIYSLNF